MRLKIYLTSTFFALLFFGFLFPKAAFADTFTLSGHVQDSSGNAISGSTVTVNDTNNDSTTTDSSGNYSLSISSGTYNVQVTPPSGSNFSSAIALSQNISTNTVLNFVLTPSGTVTLSGKVFDTSGTTPIANQVITLRQSSNNAFVTSATTDSSGNYSIQVTPNTYTLLVSATDNDLTVNAPQIYTMQITNFLLNQSTLLNVTIPLKKVIMHVQDPSNNPVSNVQLQTSPFSFVFLNYPIGNGLTANVESAYGVQGLTGPVTDQNGNVTLWLFPTDSSSNHSYTFAAVPPSGSTFSTTTLANQKFSTDTNLSITMQQPVTLSGHILDTNGAAIPNQSVALRRSSDNTIISSVTTDSSGAYSFQAAPGTYTLGVNATNDFTVNAPQIYSLQAANLSLTQNTNFDLILPLKKVTVHVQDVANNPISNAQIQTSPLSNINLSLPIGNNLTANAESGYGAQGLTGPLTDQNGNVTLWLFPTDTNHSYTISSLSPTGSNYATTSISNLHITADTNETITMQQPITLSGHLYDRDGNPVANEAVRLLNNTNNSVITSVNTASDGSYSLQASSGTYTLSVISPTVGNDLSKEIPQILSVIKTSYLITQSTTLDITLPLKKISVHVQDNSNNPVAGVIISATAGGFESQNLSIGGGITGVDGTADYGVNSLTGPQTDQNGNVTLWLFPTDSRQYAFVATPPTGSIYSTFTLNNISVSGDQTELVSLQYNHATPVTTATLSPTPFSDGTYADPTTVTLSASAASGFSVASTHYTIDGGSQQAYIAPFTITGAGNHTITYWSVDNTGVPEATNTKNFTITEAYNLTGTVYNDANQNGFQDTGESGVAGATVSLNTGQTTTTDSNGTYTFSTLESGTYTEILTVPTGYTPTTTNPVSVPLAANTTENFGIAQQQATPVVAINAGGDTQGDYAADTDYSGGTTYSSSDAVDTSAVTNPAPQAVYQTVRYGNTFSYTIPNLSANGTYTVRLHFNELYWNAAGQRVFNVALNGSQVLSNFDIYQTAGGKNKAITEQFPTTADSNGNITINFSTVTDNAMVNGIEVYSGTLPSPTPTPTPTPVSSYAISAGGPGAGSYVADTDFTGGTTYNTSASIDTSNVTNPAPQSVYQNVRYGNFSYTIPTYSPNTNYSVRLDFAEPYWNAAGQREFNVTINGTQVLNNFDVYQEAGGQNKAVAETFTTTSDSNGLIHIQFTTVTDNAMVSGIQISQQ